MPLIDDVLAGFRTVDADAAIKAAAHANVHRWLTDGAFAVYRPQLEWLIQERKWAGILDRFFQVLPFGTGGRRGPVGIGPNRMNFWTLRASVQGHCEYLKEQYPGVTRLQVAIAFDVRRFEDRGGNYNRELPNPVLGVSSRDFARYAAEVYAGNGIHVHILPPESTRYLATPELSSIIRQLKCHGGLNVSASHNPPDDNGGKFYDERGAQPIPPDDQIMSDLVEQVTRIETLPWTDAIRGGKIHFLDDSTHHGYIELCRKQSLIQAPKFDEFDVVFTPLHGVGMMTAFEVLEQSGFRPTPVAEQAEPNGQFPNVTKSPNPEVPESLDRAIALATERGSDLVLATDPDADRIGAAASDGRGGFRFLTGNEICALLAHFKLDRLTVDGRMPPSPLVVVTAVTTRLVTRVAQHFGVQVVNDLPVGLKYIAEVIRQLEQDGRYQDVTATPADYVIGGEESHGILATPQMRDKDAASAALLLAEMALHCKRRGSTVPDYLESLHQQFGYFCNDLKNIILTGIEGKQKMARMLDRLRADGPKSIAGLAVTHVDDWRDEDGRMGPLQGATDAASRNVLAYQLGDSARVTIRPSGTEPKAKVYVETLSRPRKPGMSDEAWRTSCRSLRDQCQRLADEFVKIALNAAGP
jgi:phosphoglucomutase